MLVETEELGLQFGLWDVNKQNIIVYGVGGGGSTLWRMHLCHSAMCTEAKTIHTDKILANSVYYTHR